MTKTNTRVNQAYMFAERFVVLCLPLYGQDSLVWKHFVIISVLPISVQEATTFIEKTAYTCLSCHGHRYIDVLSWSPLHWIALLGANAVCDSLLGCSVGTCTCAANISFYQFVLYFCDAKCLYGEKYLQIVGKLISNIDAGFVIVIAFWSTAYTKVKKVVQTSSTHQDEPNDMQQDTVSTSMTLT